MSDRLGIKLSGLKPQGFCGRGTRGQRSCVQFPDRIYFAYCLIYWQQTNDHHHSFGFYMIFFLGGVKLGKLKGESGPFFDHNIKAIIAAAAILTVTYGGWVLVPLGCFQNVKKYKSMLPCICCATTSTYTWYTFMWKRQYTHKLLSEPRIEQILRYNNFPPCVMAKWCEV